MSRYLVTGCAGFIGSHLTDALLARGDDVIGLDAFTNYYARDERANLERAIGRGLSPRPLDLSRDDLPLLLDMDGVFHLAAQPGVEAAGGTASPVRAGQHPGKPAPLRGGRAETTPRGHGLVFACLWKRPDLPHSRGRHPPAGVSLRRHKAGLRVACPHVRRVLRPSGRLLRFFSVYGPRQRPDMAFARIISALLAGIPSSFTERGSSHETSRTSTTRPRLLSPRWTTARPQSSTTWEEAVRRA